MHTDPYVANVLWKSQSAAEMNLRDAGHRGFGAVRTGEMCTPLKSMGSSILMVERTFNDVPAF